MTAIAKFSSYKITPFFLHHDFQQFYKHFIENRLIVKQDALNFLIESIEYQKNRENIIYRALDIDPDNWEEISIKLFGKSDKANENNIESFLKYFTQYIKENVRINFSELTNGMSIDEYEKNLSKLTGENKQKELDKIIAVLNNFISNYTDPVNKYVEWLRKNHNLTDKESITVEQMEIITQFFNESRALRAKNDSDFFDKNGDALPIGSQGILRMFKLLKSVSGFLSTIIGNIGEKATIEFMATKKRQITGAIVNEIYGTSSFDSNGRNLINKNVEVYQAQQKAIQDSLKEINVGFRTFNRKKKNEKNKTISSPYTDFEFGYVFSESNTDTLSKNLKADEIFELDVNINGKIKTEKVGISSKTSYTDSGELKLYSGSFYSLFENMFKSSEISGANKIGEIVNFLIYSVFNGYGSGSYGSYNFLRFDEEKGRSKAITEKIQEISFIEGNALDRAKFQFRGIRFTTNRDELTTGAHHRIFSYDKDYIPNEESTDIEKDSHIDDKKYTNFFTQEIKPLFEYIIQMFAYQWFTGGTSEYTHADFFSVFSDGVHYFYPMSKILETILNSLGSYILKQDIISGVKDDLSNNFGSSNPLTLENYRDTWTYDAMEALAAKSLKKSGTITVKKGILFKNSEE